MSVWRVTIKVKTLSNLCIGGTPQSFEIGGVDLHTVTNYQGLPYIPASSIKGATRNIVRNEGNSDIAEKIKNAYKKYIKDVKLKQNHSEKMKALSNGKEIEAFLDDIENKASANYLFGIERINQLPKLMFNDLSVVSSTEDAAPMFSIDSKNSIDQKTLTANPRRYKTVRPGIEFQGEIMFWDMDKLVSDELTKAMIIEFVTQAVLKFNEGIYRLGNSGSRGYGRVNIEIVSERK